MPFNLPPQIRFMLYVLTGILTPIVAVLTMPEFHILPSWVSLIWAGEVTFVGTLAGLNVGSK